MEKRDRNTKQPIIISGVPRSGGGIVAQILDKAGVYSGGMNKSISFENPNLQRFVIKPYLKSLKVDVRGQYPLPIVLRFPNSFKVSVESAIDLPYNVKNWFIKDAKAILIWQLWSVTYADAKWIIVRRRTGDIVQSCLKTDFMNAFNFLINRKAINVSTISQGWKWWVREYEKRIINLSNHANVKIIYPERIINGDYKQLYETLKWAGVEITEELQQYIRTFTKN